MKRIDARTMSLMLAGTFIASALTLKTPASAGTTPPAPAAKAAETPATPEAMKNLMRLVGAWDAQATLTMDGKTLQGPYHIEFREIGDGSGLYADESFRNPEFGNMSGGNLIGFDPNDGRIHWYSVDNMGTTHEHIGDWKTPDHFYMEHNSRRDGKAFKEGIDLVIKGKDEVTFLLVATLDGKEVERGGGDFHRGPLTGQNGGR